ncbi:MAG: type II toxin-antitoxin system death-on-curing family toxin [bacterium]|nr:type II toxin-antitoxin system death-on-curing family toxin [bacterium]
MQYLTASQILLIHSMLIDEYGGSHGVRDRNLLASLEHAPAQTAFGKELFPTIFLKSALYARNIITGHPFLDGNKRTGITCAAIFLENNGYIFTAKEGELEQHAILIAREKPALLEIASWLKMHSKRKRG